MSRKTIILFTVIFAIVSLILLLIVNRLIAPWAIRKQVTALMAENCKGCQFDLERLEVSLIPNEVTLFGIHLVHGEPHHSQIDAYADRIVAKISPLRLFSHELHLSHVAVFSPRVVVTEGNLSTPPTAQREQASTPWTYFIGGISARNGLFKYVRLYHPNNAVVSVRDIEASVGEWGTTAALLPKTTSGKATGQFEDSGKFILSVDAPLAAKSLKVDIDLEMSKQNIADLNHYFQRSDGVILSGKLSHGRSKTQIRGNKLTASVQANFSGFDLKFENTKERTFMATFFSNLFTDFQMHATNDGKSTLGQTKGVEIVRENGETLMVFILRGMKEAAILVAKE